MTNIPVNINLNGKHPLAKRVELVVDQAMRSPFDQWLGQETPMNLSNMPILHTTHRSCDEENCVAPVEFFFHRRAAASGKN